MATVVEVRSKPKSKWRPQALDTVVCSGQTVAGTISYLLGPEFNLHKALKEDIDLLDLSIFCFVLYNLKLTIPSTTTAKKINVNKCSITALCEV